MNHYKSQYSPSSAGGSTNVKMRNVIISERDAKAFSSDVSTSSLPGIGSSLKSTVDIYWRTDNIPFQELADALKKDGVFFDRYVERIVTDPQLSMFFMQEAERKNRNTTCSRHK